VGPNQKRTVEPLEIDKATRPPGREQAEILEAFA